MRIDGAATSKKIKEIPGSLQVGCTWLYIDAIEGLTRESAALVYSDCTEDREAHKRDEKKATHCEEKSHGSTLSQTGATRTTLGSV
jgi:hypothetical protein